MKCVCVGRGEGGESVRIVFVQQETQWLNHCQRIDLECKKLKDGEGPGDEATVCVCCVHGVGLVLSCSIHSGGCSSLL